MYAMLYCSGQTSAGSVSGFMMALANTYGLLFIILLLGHGLIQVPRQLWQTSFNDKELQRLYFVATQVLHGRGTTGLYLIPVASY